MELLATIIILLAVIMVIMKISQSKRRSEKVEISMPYKARYLLTKHEYNFYKVLKNIADKHNCLICPKVGLKDIVDITDKRNYMKWFAKISQKHVDFSICDKELKPLFALELDDKSHEKESVQRNDNFKNSLFLKIELPLIRVRSGNYNDLENLLFPSNE